MDISDEYTKKDSLRSVETSPVKIKQKSIKIFERAAFKKPKSISQLKNRPSIPVSQLQKDLRNSFQDLNVCQPPKKLLKNKSLKRTVKPLNFKLNNFQNFQIEVPQVIYRRRNSSLFFQEELNQIEEKPLVNNLSIQNLCSNDQAPQIKCPCLKRFHCSKEDIERNQLLAQILEDSYFSNSNIISDKYESLAQDEKDMVIMILRKKFQIIKEGRLGKIVTKPKSENRWKFIIKKTFKFLKKKLKHSGVIFSKNDKLEDEKLFYEFYFRSLAEQLKVPIENFYLPNSKLRKVTIKKESIYTVKKGYIQLLC